MPWFPIAACVGILNTFRICAINMTKWIIAAVAVIAIWLWWSGAPSPDKLAPVSFDNRGKMVWTGSEELSSTKDLKYRATLGAYNIVQFHSDACPYCKQLEGPLDAMMKRRPDVVVTSVRLPSPPAECSGGMDTAQFNRCEPYFDKVKAEYKRLGVCHTPHVAIFDPKGKRIAEDSCNGRDGLNYLWKWLRVEGVG
jgi:thioredoxin-related protein